MASKITSPRVLVRMLPQSSSSAPDLVPGIKPMKRNASPSMREKITPTEVSGLNSPRSARGPTTAAANRLKAKAPINGLKPIHRPSSAPAKAACDMHTPINGICISTTKTPTLLQAMPPRKAVRMAFCMNWYSKIDNSTYLIPEYFPSAAFSPRKGAYHKAGRDFHR